MNTSTPKDMENAKKFAEIKENFKQKRYKKKVQQYRSLWFACIVLVAILAFICLIGVLFSPRFNIYRVTVLNKSTLSIRERDIVRTINLKKDSNIYLTSCKILERRLKRAYPRIEKVVISRKGIHELTVNVIEREPLGMFAAITPPTFIDENGIIFRHDNKDIKETEKIPKIIGIVGPERKLVEGTKFSAKYIDNTINILRLAISTNDTMGIILTVDTITVDNRGNVTLNLKDGPVVYLGMKDNVDKMLRVKMAAAKLQSSKIDLESVEYMDARSLDLTTGKGFVFKRKR